MKTVAHLLDCNYRLITIDAGRNAREAAAAMQEARVGALLVTRQSLPVGVLTERDLIRLVTSATDPQSVLVSDLMTHPVHMVELHTPLDECRQLMTDRHIRHLSVHHRGRPIAMISIRDLMRVQTRFSEALVDDVQASIHTYR